MILMQLLSMAELRTGNVKIVVALKMATLLMLITGD